MIIEIEGKRVEVDDSFRTMSPQEQERTVEEIAGQLRITKGADAPEAGPKLPMMSQFNRGAADVLGSYLDIPTPMNMAQTAIRRYMPGSPYTGDNTQDLTAGLKGLGVAIADDDPQGMGQGFARGAGTAVASLPAIALGAQGAKTLGGLAGGVADTAYRSLAGKTGLLSEALAGGISGGAREVAKDAGAPEWVQDATALAAPMAVPMAATVAAAPFKYGAVGQLANQASRNVKAAAMPYLKSGATEVASRRLVGLAGGPDRAAELRGRIDPENLLNLTPAQQTDDPAMLAVEQMAAREDQALRARLEGRAEASRGLAVDALATPGDIEDTRAFFETRRREFAQDLKSRADNVISQAQRSLEGVGPVRSEEENAVAVSQGIRKALDSAVMEERQLWDAVPVDVQVPTTKTRELVARFVETTPYAQRNDIPKVAVEMFGPKGGAGDDLDRMLSELTGGGAQDGPETVSEMHGLYSELRRIARSAMAGNDQNKNRARIANALADAILQDMGAVDGTTAVGRQINEARAYSAALHETFDQGEVGRLLKKTLDGDLSVAPELALQRTVARPGVAGAVGARDIEEAAPQASGYIKDFIKGQFLDAAVTPTGEFNNKSAQAFLRRNGPLLERYPELRKDVAEAVRNRASADEFATRVSSRLKALGDAKLSAGAAVLNGPPSSAIQAFKTAQNPVRQARLILNEAAKDETGKALSGVKSLLSAELTKDPTGAGVEAALNDPKLKAAFRVIFTPAEISRMRRIGKELAKLDRSQQAAPSIGGSLSGAEVSKLIEFPARIIAARHGAAMGGGGGASIQTAGMASDRIKAVLGRLAKDRASQMLADAVEDPELFRMLLSDVRRVPDEDKLISRALPYLVGGVAEMTQQ